MFDHQFINSLPTYDQEGQVKLPLEGLTVLDFTHYIAGPLASMLLADLGAQVVKVEAPGGDKFRSYPPHDDLAPEEGGAYLWANRNKLGIEIDLKSPVGKQIIKKLIKEADVIIENFGNGVMDRLGFGYIDTLQINPRVVYCSVSAYGRAGEFAKRPGFDSVVQAESGFVSMNGYADRPGVRTASSVMDIGTAMLASNGILAALYERNCTGKGRQVDVSLYGSALLMNGYATMQALCTGESAPRCANTSPDSCPTGVFECRDTSFFLHCGNSDIFQRLMTRVLGRDDLATRPQYQTAKGRLADRENLFSELVVEFSKYSWMDLKPLLEQAKVPAGEVRDIKTALLSKETEELKLVEKIEHEDLGWIPNVRTPITFEGRFGKQPVAAPVRGRDTIKILKNIALYDDSEIAEFMASGALYAAQGTANKQ